MQETSATFHEAGLRRSPRRTDLNAADSIRLHAEWQFQAVLEVRSIQGRDESNSPVVLQPGDDSASLRLDVPREPGTYYLTARGPVGGSGPPVLAVAGRPAPLTLARLQVQDGTTAGPLVVLDPTFVPPGDTVDASAAARNVAADVLIALRAAVEAAVRVENDVGAPPSADDPAAALLAAWGRTRTALEVPGAEMRSYVAALTELLATVEPTLRATGPGGHALRTPLADELIEFSGQVATSTGAESVHATQRLWSSIRRAGELFRGALARRLRAASIRVRSVDCAAEIGRTLVEVRFDSPWASARKGRLIIRVQTAELYDREVRIHPDGWFGSIAPNATLEGGDGSWSRFTVDYPSPVVRPEHLRFFVSGLLRDRDAPIRDSRSWTAADAIDAPVRIETESEDA